MTKRCAHCKLEKSTTEFYICKARKGVRFHSLCISCSQIRKKQYYHDNRNKILQQNKEYDLKNPDKARETRQKTYQKHKINRLSKMKEYASKNQIFLKIKRQEYYIRCKTIAFTFFIDLLKKYPILITYIAKTLEFRQLNAQIAKTLRGRINKKLRQKHLKQITSLNLIGCSIDNLRQYIQNQWQPGMTWENHGVGPDKWQFDHKRPCCSFDLRELNQQQQCFHYTNLQPLWFKDHREKTSEDVKNKFTNI